MELYNYKCEKCGYETQYNKDELDRECPVCGHKNIQQTGLIDEQDMLEHLQEGMNIFGIEGLIEIIENPAHTPLTMRIPLTQIIQKYYPMLRIKKINEEDFK